MNKTDLICFSHLRWDFVFQRPQHLMTRAARSRRVFFFEEPIFSDLRKPKLEIVSSDGRLNILRPNLPSGHSDAAIAAMQTQLVNDLIRQERIKTFVTWYYTPMARKFTRNLQALGVVYDCMDQLSHFKNAPQDLASLESELFKFADVVFTGGHSLFENKKNKHYNVHPFPSSVDVAHFNKARFPLPKPLDIAKIPRPRLGFIGVIDERFDIPLMTAIAKARPHWHFVLVGPIVKIDPEVLPRHPNVHYLGCKAYEDLPAYLAHWDLAMLPFARNEATRYISPTKTPEYLAAGLRVVSTSIRDVIRPYGKAGLVEIADEPEDFIGAAERLMVDGGHGDWLRQADKHLSNLSWDTTFSQMWQHVEQAIDQKSDRRFSPMRQRKERLQSRSSAFIIQAPL